MVSASARTQPSNERILVSWSPALVFRRAQYWPPPKGHLVKMYLLSLGAGIFVGIIYSLLQVRSPAPPLVALVGLLGILAGEQAIPVGKQILSGVPFLSACARSHAIDHIFGELPGRHRAKATAAAAGDKEGKPS
jgi:XapX domain-containing protein